MGRRVVAVLVVAALVGSGLVGGAVSAAASCAGPTVGGEWASYGQNLSNTRHQAAGPGADLAPVFGFSIGAAGAGGNFQSTAVVADGCVFAGTSAGWVLAANADTGELVWKTQFGAGLLISGVFAPAIADGRVHVISSNADSPFAAALDQATGTILWTTPLADPLNSVGVNASAVVFDGLLFVGVFGGDGDPNSHPPFYILDAATGEILKKTYVIPQEQWADGYAGGGIWATGVVDPATKHLFTGTANPYSKRNEHAHTNAILKIDMDRTRPTFGTIIDSYKGNVDQYFPGLDQQPACQLLGDLQPAGYSVFCLQLDIDFGASPNLYVDDQGRTIVGELQKSAVYHAVDTATMEPIWTAVVGIPYAGGSASTSAFDGDSIYAEAYPGLLYSLDKDTGAVNWVVPVGDGGHYEPITVSNGIVYTITNFGTLNGYDAATGAAVVTRSLAADAGDACTSLGGGVSVARGTLYAVCDIGAVGGGWVVAYR